MTAPPYYSDDVVTLHHGDCLDVLRGTPDASIDSCVTDPPYLLGFMGREWDTRAAHEHLDWHRAWCDEALRVLKPGGHLLAFGGSRTWHRLACAIEDAGFEVRDSIAWLYGSGFPKSLDVSKAIDKAGGAEREVIETRKTQPKFAHAGDGRLQPKWVDRDTVSITTPATDDARTWQGWGTALKPAFEPIVVARKPLAGTVAANVLAHGTGALNIDGCRIPGQPKSPGTTPVTANGNGSTHGAMTRTAYTAPSGRWPANVVLDESQAAALDEQSGVLTSPAPYVQQSPSVGIFGPEKHHDRPSTHHGDSGGASRFFYVAKASTDERPRNGTVAHPTVKPLDLMRWLVRLVTPPGGVVLDPFLGSGTTAEACIVEGFRCIGIEREADYLPLILARITKPIQPDIFGGAA